jgi:outer membrane protein TolC
MSRTHWSASSLACVILLAGPLASAQPALPPKAPAPPPPASTSLELRDAPKVEDTLTAALATQRGGLTSEEAARKAVTASPTLEARRAEIDAAAAQVDQAMAAFLPRLTLRAGYTRLSPVDISLGGGAIVGVGTPGALTVGPCPGGAGECLLDSAGQPAGAASFSIETPLNNYALTASLSVPVSDYVFRLRSARAAVKSNETAANLTRDADKASVAAEARTAFYNWARAIGQVAVAEKTVERAKARLADVQTAFALGTATKADGLRLEALVAGSELLVAQAVALRELTAEQLRILMNQTGNLALGENVLEPDAPLPSSESLEGLIAEAMNRRLELKSLSARVTALDATATATRAGMLPRLDAFADLTYANPNQRSFGGGAEWKASWSVGAAITWSPNDALGGSASASGIDANTRALVANQAALKNGVRLEVTAAFLDRQKAQTALGAAGRNATASQEAYRVAVDLYRVGRATTTEVIDVEAELVSAQLQLLNARIDIKLARLRLAHAVGR